jgi:hypothetical protein
MQNGRQFFELGTFAHVYDQRSPTNFTGLHRQVGELRDELDGEVVDAVVAEILKGLEHGGLP